MHAWGAGLQSESEKFDGEINQKGPNQGARERGAKIPGRARPPGRPDRVGDSDCGELLRAARRNLRWRALPNATLALRWTLDPTNMIIDSSHLKKLV